MSAPVPFDASGLAATVERARMLLDEGDVIAARLLAAAAYDQGKAAADFAARFGAAERLVAKARRLQGDALLIETRAKVQLADHVDAAQAAGAVARGRPKTLPDGNTSATLEELGLSAKDVHDARKLRDAERREPGIVARAIEARLQAGLEPSRANLRAAIGTDSATRAERGDNLYETPREATRALLALESFAIDIWEPACGRGAISRMLEDAGREVFLSDLVDYGTAGRLGEVQRVDSFLDTSADYWLPDGPHDGRFDIVTNPPYGAALNAFVAHALRVHRPRKMALLLNLNFLCGTEDDDRNFALDIASPARVLVFSRRLPMMHRDGWDGPEASSRMNTAWFVWERDASGSYSGRKQIVRVDWKDFVDAPALPPVVAEAPRANALADALIEAEAAKAVARRGKKPAESAASASALRWVQKSEGGRAVAMLGKIECGAVFPDSDGPGCGWSLWVGGVHGPHKRARSIEAGKAALEKLFAQLTGVADAI